MMAVLVNDINTSYFIQAEKASQSTHEKISYKISMKSVMGVDLYARSQ
jgi:hypothetical protein